VDQNGKEISTETRSMISLAGAAADMKMRDVLAKDFFWWKRHLRMESDWESLPPLPAKTVEYMIDRLMQSFSRDELMRVSTEIIRASRDEKNVHEINELRKHYDQKYSNAAIASRAARTNAVSPRQDSRAAQPD
jgi:hypothetical protein